MTSSRKIALPLLAACVFTAFGCATTPKKPELDANGKPIEYVWITPTGSNVPVKVRKDQVQTSSTDAARNEETLRRLQQQGARTPQQNNGSTGP